MDFNEFEVRQEIAKLGYGVGACTNKAFMITKKGGAPRKYDGLQRDIPIGSLDVPSLIKIMKTSSTAKEAASRCISICKGEADPYDPASKNKNIDEMVQAGIKEALSSLGLTPEMLVKLKTESDVKSNEPEVPKQQPKKRGRPKKVQPNEGTV